MYKNRQVKWILGILITIMVILSIKFIIIRYEYDGYKNSKVTNNVKVKNVESVEKFGYSDILKCLNKNKDFKVETINMMENELCSVDVSYKGDINLLYSSLIELNKSKNLLSISKIFIHKDTEITNIGINFKKNK